MTGPFSPADLAKLWGLIGALVGFALLCGWVLDVKGGTVLVVAAPYVFLWFDARRVLFQFDPSGVRIGNVRLPWADVTALVVADSPALGPQVLLGTRLRDGALIPAGAEALPADPAMPAQLHVAVERRKFHLAKLTAKARRYAPGHVQIVNAADSAGQPLAGNPYAATGHPGAGPRMVPTAPPAGPGPRWGIVLGAGLACLAVGAVLAAALPHIAMVFPYEGEGATGGIALRTEDVLALSDLPPGGPPGGLVTWPSLLFLLAALTVGYRALTPYAPSRAPRVVGLLCAGSFPLVLLGNDAFDGQPLGTYESGWWLLHLGAFAGLAAFAAMDLTLARGAARTAEAGRSHPLHQPGSGPY
ncbi:hypothetical protein ACFQLX_15085 [Streptomyces polyrhachis]|uniref:PH domain-containing protein n=1 Tax=Streptomyces polyrhachis TaxID=1282885 RepID=A0ABW2GFJ2_9ACTN